MIIPAKPFKLRFSTRAMLVVMTLLTIWCGYSMNWIRQRRELIESTEALQITTGSARGIDVRAPGLLFLFGEPGYALLAIDVLEGDPELDRIRAIFPEAKCEGWTGTSGE